MRVFVEGVGVRGPGLEGWDTARLRLTEPESYSALPMQVPLCALLPAATRRRTVGSVNLALSVGLEALERSKRVAQQVPSIFSSSCGDGTTIHEIIEALSSPEREVSPTRFHNSVHNAPAGYWSIATQSHEASTSLCGYDASFSAGLLEAAVLATVEQRAVILVVYDLPYPMPLHQVRPIGAPFGMALVLTTLQNPNCLLALDIEVSAMTEVTSPMRTQALESLRLANPAARALPLLSALACGSAEQLYFDYTGGNRLAVSTSPC